MTNEVLLSPITLKELELLIDNAIHHAFRKSERYSIDPDNLLLSRRQASKYLNLPEEDIRLLAKQLKIPSTKKQGKRYFKEFDLSLWSAFNKADYVQINADKKEVSNG